MTDQTTDSNPAFSDVSHPCLFVVFGATGDLVARKIAPALYNLEAAGLLDPHTAVVGVARRPLSDEQFRGQMLDAVRRFSRTQPIDEARWASFAARWHYQGLQVGQPEHYAALAARLADLDTRYQAAGNRLFYLALPPVDFGMVGENLGQAGLSRPGRAGGVRAAGR